MDDKAWTKLFVTGRSVSYPKDSVIVRDGVATDDLYRVLDGRVRVEKGDETHTAGQGAVLNLLDSGNTFGEMSFLDGSLPCANCIAESEPVTVMQLSKSGLAAVLDADPDLRAAFYKQIAINVTQRLQKVSKTTADIREAPRGLAQPESASSTLSAKKLLKVRRRFGVADSELMACMTACTMLTPAKRKAHGTLYVFESALGFVSKVFGLKQHEVVNLDDVSEVLRETLHLKKEEGAIEVQLKAHNKAYVFHPQHVDDTFDAIVRSRQQHASARALRDEQGESHPHARAEAGFTADPHAAHTAPDSAQALQALLEKATLERYKPGDTIIAANSRPCTLFNIAKGRVAVEMEHVEASGDVHSVKILTLYQHAVFGEMSFLNGDVACASVVAEVDTEVWQIKAASIESMLTSSGTALQGAFYKHLATYLTDRVRQLTEMVGDALTARGGEIALEEVLSNPVFFSLFKRFLTEEKLVDSQLLYFMAELNEYLEMPANDHLLKFARKIAQKYLHGATPMPTAPGVVADIDALLASDTLPPRDIFTPVLNEVYGTLSKSAYRLFQQSTAFQPLLELKAKSAEVPKVQGFKMLQILGEGYEGKVLQVRKKDCGCMYALKVLDKVVLASRSRRWQLHCSRERECLIACDHPYIVRILYAFQTPQYLYMLQEHVPNHTLAGYLEAHDGRPVAEAEVRFMVAQLALALAHMHARSILYRDLKPANVLIDEDGHLRVVDMGMATKLDPETGRRKSVCGTQRYMAPEMKAKEPYNQSVDWYSLGKLTIDCQGRNPHAHVELMRFWETSGLLEVVEGLLIKDPKRRLGCGEDGVRSIQRMPFFKSIDWAALDAKRVPTALRREWFVREPDLAMSRQFRNGEDINKVVEKLQHISLDGTIPDTSDYDESGPGVVPGWDFIHPRAVYDEYVTSPYLNHKSLL